MNRKTRNIDWVLAKLPPKGKLRWARPEGAGRCRTSSLWQEVLRMASRRVLVTLCRRYVNKLSLSAWDCDSPHCTGAPTSFSELWEIYQGSWKRTLSNGPCFLNEQEKKLLKVDREKGLLKQELQRQILRVTIDDQWCSRVTSGKMSPSRSLTKAGVHSRDKTCRSF